MPLRRPLLGLVLLTVACGNDDPGTYDLETWRSPLAAQFDGEGDPAVGEDLYYNETWTDDTPYAFTCDSCHSADAEDTLETDAGELNRAAHTTWNAALRETWKASHTWDQEESDRLGAYGGQICIPAYYPDGGEMTPEQAAHLEAWMKTNIDDDAAGNPTAEPLDHGSFGWDSQDAFVASAGDGDWLYGSDLGDVTAGEALVARHCSSCHVPEGETAPVFYTAATAELGTLIARIRRVDLEGYDRPNDRMPRISWDRLSDEELADTLAFLTAGREG